MLMHIGGAMINAAPMTFGDFTYLMGDQLKEDDDPLREGFIVERLDGMAPNTDIFNGFVSWSPNNVFHSSYRCSGEMTTGDAISLISNGYKMSNPLLGDGSWLQRSDCGQFISHVIPVGDWGSKMKVNGWVPTKHEPLSNEWFIYKGDK